MHVQQCAELGRPPCSTAWPARSVAHAQRALTAIPLPPSPLQTFTNDQSGDFSKWACNPRVVEMLREAKRLLDEG